MRTGSKEEKHEENIVGGTNIKHGRNSHHYLPPCEVRVKEGALHLEFVLYLFLIVSVFLQNYNIYRTVESQMLNLIVD